MTAERPARDDILTTLRPADRIPSIGHQLELAPLPPVAPSVPAFGTQRPTTAPVPLNLWDTSADSIPETWSL